MLGPTQTAASRLNLTQAFNSLGTTVGPLLGSMFILTAAVSAGSPVDTAQEIETVQTPYLILAGLLFAIAIVFSQFKLPVVKGTDATTAAADDHDVPSVWKHSHLVLGAVAIFMYVGAEVAIGSFLVNFMSQPEVGGLHGKVAGRYLALYWGGAMVGRFIGALVLRVVKPGYVLAFNAACAIVLLLVAMSSAGKVAMWAVLAIGLFNSIMFPTIFTLGLARLGRHTGEGSGVLCMAIVGGAIVPVMQGYFADTIGLLHVVLRAGHLLCLHRVLRTEGSRGSQRARYRDFGRQGAGQFVTAFSGLKCPAAGRSVEWRPQPIDVCGGSRSCVRDCRGEENPARATHDGWQLAPRSRTHATARIHRRHTAHAREACGGRASRSHSSSRCGVMPPGGSTATRRKHSSRPDMS